MYVCLCNGHRDRELKELAARGVSCVREAYKQLGGDPVCGRCLDFAQDVIDTARPLGSETRAPSATCAASSTGAAGIGAHAAFVPAEPVR